MFPVTDSALLLLKNTMVIQALNSKTSCDEIHVGETKKKEGKKKKKRKDQRKNGKRRIQHTPVVQGIIKQLHLYLARQNVQEHFAV